MPSPDGSAIRLHHLRIAVNTRNVGSAGTHQGSPLPAILAAVVDQQIQPVILGPPVAGAGLAHSAARATPAGYNAPKTFDAKVDAEAWLTDRRREIDRELWSPLSGREERPSAPFGDYAEGWLKQRGIKDRTREHYRKLLDKHIGDTFAGVELRDITPAAVRHWYATTAVGTPTMRAHSYSLLGAIMQTALADDLIDSNPCRIAGASSARRVHKIRSATLDEVATVTAEMPEAYHAFILMAVWLALRYGELTELRRKDIDLIDEVVRVRRAVVRVGDNFKVSTPKSDAGIRDVTIPPHLTPVIEDHLRCMPAVGDLVRCNDGKWMVRLPKHCRPPARTYPPSSNGTGYGPG